MAVFCNSGVVHCIIGVGGKLEPCFGRLPSGCRTGFRLGLVDGFSGFVVGGPFSTVGGTTHRVFSHCLLRGGRLFCRCFGVSGANVSRLRRLVGIGFFSSSEASFYRYGHFPWVLLPS